MSDSKSNSFFATTILLIDELMLLKIFLFIPVVNEYLYRANPFSSTTVA